MSDETLKARGVFRDPGDERTLSVAFNRKPSDAEMRAIHDYLRDLFVATVKHS